MMNGLLKGDLRFAGLALFLIAAALVIF